MLTRGTTNAAVRPEENIMNVFTVDHDLCRKDGICAQVCPVHIIDAEVGAYPSMDKHKAVYCIGCGQCMAFCPTQACAAPGLDRKDCQLLRPEHMPTAEQVEELVASRRSVRNFKNKNIPREQFESLLAAARFAPTAKNVQNLRWVVLESRQQVVKLAELVVDWMRTLLQIDPALNEGMHASGLVRAWERGVDVITRTAPHLAVVVAPQWQWGRTDSAIAATYLELLAQAQGIGCCWGGYLCTALEHPAAQPVRDFLGIGPDEMAYAAQMMGYPLFKARVRPVRKDASVTWI